MFTGSTTSVYTEPLDTYHQQSLRDSVPYKVCPLSVDNPRSNRTVAFRLRINQYVKNCFFV
ncbi:hypothetical protein SDC9_97615 [bioreactor metagenome]|uniref:Uncharacterized protein n=1 Tax=bioreactor metagenome TaxID=1076179 RepID=A0A645ACG3_9ZZZZ